MRKIITSVCVVTIGLFSFAAYKYWPLNQPSTKNISGTSKSELNINQSPTASNDLYHQGIDTILILNGDTFFLKDLSAVLGFVVAQTDTHTHNNEHGSNYKFWNYYLTKPHPNVGTIEKYFNDAAIEFNVPVQILHAIGQIENNWTQIGPSIDQGWGIMHLVDNHYCTTITEAAQELKLSPQTLKDNAKENIRGAAALLAKYAGNKRDQFTSYEDWYPAMKKFSGLINGEIQTIQLSEYTRVLYKGSKSVTLWGEEIVLQPQSKIYRK